MARLIRHVILDRDGVLNVERSGHRYVHDWSQWHWVAGAREGLAILRRKGITISVATNQSGVGRHVLTRNAVDAIHARMVDGAARAGGAIDRVLVCPHAPDAGCTCRKPLPGLLLQAIQASSIPRDATLVVGDDLRDLQAAKAADLPAVLVRSGKGRVTETMIPRCSVEIFDDLRAFAAAQLSCPLIGESETP